MLWAATAPDNLWGPNGRTVEGGTQFQNTVNSVTANVDCIRKLEIKKGQAIYVCYIPASAEALATLKNLSAIVTQE